MREVESKQVGTIQVPNSIRNPKTKDLETIKRQVAPKCNWDNLINFVKGGEQNFNQILIIQRIT